MGDNQQRQGDWTERPEIVAAHHLASHDGVITIEEALACGFTRDQIRRRIDRGLWVRLARGVFLSLEHPLGDAARIRATAAAHSAVIDRTSAAWWHGLLHEAPGQVTASLPRTTRAGSGCTVDADLKRRTFPSEDVTRLRGIPVTGTALSILAPPRPSTTGSPFSTECSRRTW
ncbi:type IV toxin-antitoxin system AbiEi family antitoxin domain-containing protein [Gordonia neofelifaecis]|uniref:type IV toxin-antitoxin system AbiEi family antitoxin domain-containing protein n=1 Tax=Gordonia neofelifaecis TaxID=945692 RepID=UPI0002FADFA5|nr:type IV toxin-antitoxin system AbiEi family antitoxin domain-containing protein [Gordonia neofelifaecis]